MNELLKTLCKAALALGVLATGLDYARAAEAPAPTAGPGSRRGRPSRANATCC